MEDEKVVELFFLLFLIVTLILIFYVFGFQDLCFD